MLSLSVLAPIQLLIVVVVVVVGTASTLSVHKSADDGAIFNVDSDISTKDRPLINDRPIIGILAQEISFSIADFYPNSTSYISASYVKFVESAGARVVPVLINQDEDYYQLIFNSTNGLLIPGGSVSIVDSGYAKAGKILYDLAVDAFNSGDDYYPIWGTCLGFELMALLSVDGQENLQMCNSWGHALPLDFTEAYSQSRIGQASRTDIDTILSTENVTANFHHWCLTQENFTKFGLDKVWTNLATGNDLDGLEFIALLESKVYPFWLSQFHPEKNAYEWTLKFPMIPHSANAVRSASFFAEFFVQECRKSGHAFASRDLEEQFLIYNRVPVFTGQSQVDFTMVQSYLFP